MHQFERPLNRGGFFSIFQEGAIPLLALSVFGKSAEILDYHGSAERLYSNLSVRSPAF